MANKQQPGRQNMWQTVLMFTVVYLATMMMCNSRQQAPAESRSTAEILGNVANPAAGEPPPPPKVAGAQYDVTKGSMYWADSMLDWSTLTTINKIYQDQLNSERDAQVNDLKEKLKKRAVTPDAVRQANQDWDSRIQTEKLRGDVLIADAEYKYALAHDDELFRQYFPQAALEPEAATKYGLVHNDTATMRNAFQTLAGDQRSLQGTPLWTQEFPVPATALAAERFPWRQMSGKDLYDRLTVELSARNKRDLIYGVFPGYQIIDALVHLTGAQPGFSYAFAAFLLALMVRVAVYPLVQRQLMWGRKMQQLAPLIKEIRAEFTDKNGKITDQAELQKRTMALYGEYGINPLAGCLPAGIQMPLFITVYQFMLRYQFAFRNGTFLWVNPHSSAATHGFLAPTLGDRDYVLIALYGITMVISTLLMPVSDPTQIKQQKLMGVGMGLFFTFFMFTGAFPTPAAFVLYWVFTNLMATAQSLRAYRMPIPPLEKVNTRTGGVFPMAPFAGQTSNGKAIGTIQMPKSTGTPAKHKPKKRK